MNRRDLITCLGGSAALVGAWPRQTRAQHVDTKFLGLLVNSPETDGRAQTYIGVFLDGLRQLGWQEGKNLRVEYRWNGADAELARRYAAELVALNPDAIFCVSTTNVLALRASTRSIPIVFIQVSDPVAQGLVTSFARPGGNITGFSAFEPAVAGKWLDLLKQIAPDTTRVAFLFHPATSPQSKIFLPAIEAAAPGFGVEIAPTPVREEAEMETALEEFASRPNGALLVPTDAFLQIRAEKVVALAARHRLPALYGAPQFSQAGGLMSYTFDWDQQFRQGASYVDRVLRGAKPADLPIQQPTHYQLVVNRAAARLLGLDVPLALLAQADVVE